MIVVKGRIKNLNIEDSKIHPLKSIDKQVVGTAMLGTLAMSSSLMTNAPIMMMAARGINAKTFTCEIDNYNVIGQFTTVQFKEEQPLIFVISREKEQSRHLVYTALDPRSGLMYMMYEMGRSKKNAVKSIIKLAFYFSIFAAVFLLISFYIYSLFGE